jgi:enoyl-CoA hydratase
VRSLELETGFVMEKALGARVLRSDDAKEGPLAFSEKRPAKFKGK